MQKYIKYILGMMLVLTSCTHKDLCYVHPHYSQVKVVINWETRRVAPVMEMRTNFMLTEGDFVIGRTDMSMYGGYIEAMPGNTYKALCYDYVNTESIYFAHENDDNFMAYTIEGTRNSYEDLFPTEQLMQEPDQLFLDKIDEVEMEELPNGGVQEIHFFPTNRLIEYTYEIRKVKGVRYVNSIGVACSGVSKSYKMVEDRPSDEIATIIFNGSKDSEAETICGSFHLFGHCKEGSNKNYLSVEVRYPSDNNTTGYRMMRWDVTDQMHDDTNNNHIVLDWDTEFEPPTNEGAGMDAKVEPWDEVWIPVEM